MHWYCKMTIILRKRKNVKKTIIVRRREYLLNFCVILSKFLFLVLLFNLLPFGLKNYYIGRDGKFWWEISYSNQNQMIHDTLQFPL